MRLKIMGLCLVAMFALTAMVSASASAAEPAFYECAKVAGGKFADKKCSSQHAGKTHERELQEGIRKGKGADKKCSKPGSGKTAKYELQEGIGKGKGGKHAFNVQGGKATPPTPAVTG